MKGSDVLRREKRRPKVSIPRRTWVHFCVGSLILVTVSGTLTALAFVRGAAMWYLFAILTGLLPLLMFVVLIVASRVFFPPD